MPPIMTNSQSDKDTLLRARLARDTTDIEVLRTLSKDQCSNVRMTAVRNRFADGEILTRLSRDREEAVKRQVVMHWGRPDRVANDPEHIILALANDPDPKVRFAVAVYCTHVPAVSEVLAKDTDCRVLYELLLKGHLLSDDTLLRIRSYFNSVLMNPFQTLQDPTNKASSADYHQVHQKYSCLHDE